MQITGTNLPELPKAASDQSGELISSLLMNKFLLLLYKLIIEIPNSKGLQSNLFMSALLVLNLFI